MQSTKRSAEDFARVNHGHDGPGPSKKPRFDLRNPSALAPDALEDDAILDADVIGARGQQVKRGAVNVDGYDSDSDNENFDQRAASRQKAKDDATRSKQEEDNDMFADLEEEEVDRDGDGSEGDVDGRKKRVKFLDEHQIEGQVKGSKSGGHVSADFSLNGKREAVDEDVESSSDSEVGDEERADAGDVDDEIGAGGKKTHAPKLDAFNMRDENEEGRFDEQGNYVRKAVDPDAKHDVWMEGISKKDMKKAQEAHEKREQERRQKAIEDDAKSDADVLKSLLPLLHPTETVLEALARLNKGQKRKPKWQIKKNTGADVDVGNGHAEQDDRANAIETITEATDLLLARGQSEVYDTARELLIRQYQRVSGESWHEPLQDSIDDNPTDNQSDTSGWQYRWADARDGGEVHGPYDANTMRAWSEAGYFGEGVEFCRHGGSAWERVPDFV